MLTEQMMVKFQEEKEVLWRKVIVSSIRNKMG